MVLEGISGTLDEDLGHAVVCALGVNRTFYRTFAERHSWGAVADRLAMHIEHLTADCEQQPLKASYGNA